MAEPRLSLLILARFDSGTNCGLSHPWPNLIILVRLENIQTDL